MAVPQGWWQAIRDNLNVIFNGIVAVGAVVGIFGIVVTNRLTQRTLENTESSAHLDQRAWLSFNADSVKLPNEKTKPGELNIVGWPIENTGKTPAYKVHSWGIIKLSAADRIPPVTEDEWSNKATHEELGIVFPSEKGRQIRNVGPLDEQQLARYRAE